MVYIWVFMMLFSTAVAFAKGNVAAMNKAVFESATSSASYGLGLIGVMALWLGVMKIAEDSKLNLLIARWMKPITRRLFPNIPAESTAMGSIVLAFAATALGLMDAATPIAIKALKDMQEYNPFKDTVSDDQAVFTAVLTSNIALVTPAVIAARVAAKSANPTEIVAPTIICTLISTILCITLTKVFAKLPTFRLPATPPQSVENEKPQV